MLRIRRIGFNLLPDSPYININDFFLAEIFCTPNMIENIGSAEIFSLIAEEIFKNLKLNLCNINLFSAAGKRAAFAVQPELAGGDNIFVVLLVSPLRR